MAAKTKLTKKELELLSKPLSELGFPVRELNTYEKRGILTVEQLLDCCGVSSTECDRRCRCREVIEDPNWEPLCHLPDISGFGEKTLREALRRLSEHGFRGS